MSSDLGELRAEDHNPVGASHRVFDPEPKQFTFFPSGPTIIQYSTF